MSPKHVVNIAAMLLQVCVAASAF